MDLKYIKETTYENILDDLYKKYSQGLDALGEPAFSKSDSEIEEEAEKLTEEFITRNS
jgi:predicted CopG family antitoxin